MLAAFIIITMLAFVAGVIIDIVLIVIKINKVDIIHKVAFFKRIGWNWQDIIRISILFVFISYLVNIGWVLTDKYLNLTRYSTYSKIATSMTLSYFIMITLLFFFVYIKYKDKIQSLGLQFRSFFKSMFLGLAGYVAIIPVLVAAVFISSGLASYFKLKPEARPILEAFLVQDGQFLLVYLMLIVCFVGPVIEEVFFRGFVYTALRKRLSSFLSITISAFFFSWLHMTLFGFLPILILGILLAYLYEKNGTLIPSIIVHIVHNSAVVIFLLIIRGLVL
jgi:hypothetical protein